MPEMHSILSSLSYQPADSTEPILDVSLGDALQTAVSTWPRRVALVEGISDKGARRRWTFEELLAEAERVARAAVALYAR